MALLVPFSIPSSPHHSLLLLQRRPHHRQQHSHFWIKSSSSSSSSSSVVTEQEDSPPLPPSETDDGLVSINSEDPQFSGCKSCGREEIERGCNGEGRIQGGIATVPGFGWWPIKAFRPCPGFVASGGRYKRRGQSMDEVASGRGRDVSLENTAKAKSSKGRQGPSRLKG